MNVTPKWLGAHTGYSLAKFGMTMATLGLASEFASDGIAANTLWPRTTIATAAVQNVIGGDRLMAVSRTPEIYADAAYEVLTSPSRELTGRTRSSSKTCWKPRGVTDFSGLRARCPAPPDAAMYPDIFLDWTRGAARP